MIRDHGIWERYKPTEEVVEGIPLIAMYSRRVGTNEDWYVYQKQFNGSTVLMTVLTLADGTYLVQAATFDASAIFPGDSRVIEETEYTGNDPQAEFGQRHYNPTQRKIGARYVRPEPKPTATETKILTALDNIIQRIERLEKR